MYILVAGAGTVGSHIAEVLLRKGHEVGIVDNNARKLDRLNENLDVITYQGDATDRRILSNARIDNADLFVAATNLDEVNLTACAIAKYMGAGKNLARVREDMYYKNREQILEIFQLEMIFSPENLAAIEILGLIKTPGAFMVESFAKGSAQLRSIVVDEKSDAIGKSLVDIKFPSDTIIAAIKRDDWYKIPSGSDVIQEDDNLYFVGKPDALDKAEKQISSGKPRREARNIIIYGGSEVGIKLARYLENSHYNVKLIESDEKKAEEISIELQKTSVIYGDASDINLLKEERVNQCDVFVATSKESDKNIIASVVAGNLGAKSIITHVEDMNHYDLAKQLNINNVISARIVASNSILRFIMMDNIRSINVLEEDKAEMIEIEVTSGSPALNKRIQDIGFPKSAIIATLVRGESVIIPGGSDEIRKGDVAIIFTHPKNITGIINILTGK